MGALCPCRGEEVAAENLLHDPGDEHAIPSFAWETEEIDQNFRVEIEVLPAFPARKEDPRRETLRRWIENIDKRNDLLNERIEDLNSDIDRLTNHADGFDYTVSVVSGVLCGFYDSFFVGAFDFEGSKAKVHKAINQYIEGFAKKRGYSGDGGLKGAVAFLENKFPIPSDSIWKGHEYASAMTHHIDDFAHHPTPLGFLCACVGALLNVGLFSDKDGHFHVEHLPMTKADIAKTISLVVFTGLLNWLANMIEAGYAEKHAEELPKPVRLLLRLMANAPALIFFVKQWNSWWGHMVSDMAGSKQTAGGGMGLPGVILSFLKSFSAIPPLCWTKLPAIVDGWFSKQKFDMRAELAVLREAGRMAVPVLINEGLVRGFYFFRRLAIELKGAGSLSDPSSWVNPEIWKRVDWDNVKPWGNRTIARMLTIATGTFTAVDAADAAIRSAVKNGPNVMNPKFWMDIVLRVNFVGVGRFVIAVGTDVGMGIKRNRLRDERIKLISEAIHLRHAKIFYMQAGMWIEAENAVSAIIEAEECGMRSLIRLNHVYQDVFNDIRNIRENLDAADELNPGLKDDVLYEFGL